MAVLGGGGVEGSKVNNGFGTALSNVEVALGSDAVAPRVDCSITVGTFYDIYLTQFVAYIAYDSTCILAQYRKTRYFACNQGPEDSL